MYTDFLYLNKFNTKFGYLIKSIIKIMKMLYDYNIN